MPARDLLITISAAVPPSLSALGLAAGALNQQARAAVRQRRRERPMTATERLWTQVRSTRQRHWHETAQQTKRLAIPVLLPWPDA